MVQCNIIFDNSREGIYFAGQTVSGRVEFTLDKPKKVRGVSVNVGGKAECKWSEREHYGTGKDRKSRTVWYTGKEEYLNSTTYLLGSPNGDIEVPPGHHTYNFSCVLPARVPSSFEGTKGFIRYRVHVNFDRPWKFDHDFKVAFTVLKPLDLNYEPSLRIASKVECIKTFCCWPCQSDPLYVTATIPQSGYVPGQAIVVNINVNNKSNSELNCVKVILRKHLKYTSHYPRSRCKFSTHDIMEQRTNGVKPNALASFDVQVKIPSVPSTDTQFCNVINITYTVVVEISVPGCHANPVLSIPITIGSIPLAPVNYSGYQSPPAGTLTITQGNVPSAPLIIDGKPNDPTPGYPEASGSGDNLGWNAPPPSYEASIYGTTDFDADNNANTKNVPFYPKYPVYNFDHAHQPTAPPNFSENEKQNIPEKI